jgi:hypothetical protein
LNSTQKQVRLDLGQRQAKAEDLSTGPPLLPAIGLGADISEELTLAFATRKIKHWMSVCESHFSCTQVPDQLPEMPTRILLLGKHKVSLHDSVGKRGIYATLSHCWGTSQVLTTTKESLAQHKLEIMWNSLPNIFRDAISLTKNLGIEYLWIDSLCIIQGDLTDWAYESARMASTYSNSYLNIAATSSSGSDGTLFMNRWTTPVPYEQGLETLSKRPMKSYRIPFVSHNTVIKARYSTRSAHENVKLLHNSAHMKRSDVFQKGPLLTRSWVFQERLLSPRTIHFHATEMIWECKDSFFCECGFLDATEQWLHDGRGIISKGRFLAFGGYESTNVRWLDCVDLYSRLRITKCTDKLPALAGLASRVALKTQSRYLAGLWECDLPRSLCWKVIGEEKDGPDTNTKMAYGKRCTPYCAPTWSWASIDLSDTGIVSSFEARTTFEHLLVKSDLLEVDDRYELIAAECSTNPDSPYGQVTSGILTIRAASLSTTLYIAESGPDFIVDLGGKCYAVDIDLNAEYLQSHECDHADKYFAEPFNKYFPRGSQGREMDVLLATLGYTEGEIDLREERSLALVLILVDGSRNRYERVGLLEFPKSQLDALDIEICTIEIV